jgi:manganese-dependent inorganic pyrophosphatase
MITNKKNYVTTYVNPDTDGVACAIALANFLSLTESTSWDPTLFGAISNETAYVLNYLNITVPEAISSLADSIAIALVDTHHKAQLSNDFPFEKVTMIVDHHPNGDIALFSNAHIINEKIGAAATIIAGMYFEKQIIDKKILSLLAFAILSNTLNFAAPSTTSLDIECFVKIKNICDINDKAMTDMFAQRSLVFQSDLYTALTSDLKIFDTKHGKVGISQLEIYDIASFLDFSKVVNELCNISNEKQLQYCLLNGVDIKSKRSYIVCANNRTVTLIKTIFDEKCVENTITVNRILLRKTDFIPALNN